FALSYFATGLLTDHELERTLRFANFARLNAWGVIPQLIAILWILDNLRAMAPPFGSDAFYQLAIFMRLDLLLPYLIGPPIAVAALAAGRWLLRTANIASEDAVAASNALTILPKLSALIVVLATISLLGGQVRNISFERFSTFFVPLLLLTAVSSSVWV